MVLGETSQIIWSHVLDTTFIHNAIRQYGSPDQLPDRLGSDRVDLVEVHSHYHRFAKEIIWYSRPKDSASFFAIRSTN